MEKTNLSKTLESTNDMKRKIFSWIYSVIIFITINVPSIKLIYSSPVINIMLLFAIWSIGIVRIVNVENGIIRLSSNQKKYLIIFFLLWLTLFVITLFNSNNTISISDYLQYMATMFIVIGITLFSKWYDVDKVFFIQIIWGTLLSLANLVYGIKLNYSLGQNYLTIGVPIAAAVISSFSLFFYIETKKRKKLILFILLLINLLGVTSVIGRTPFLLSVMIPIIILIMVFIFEKNFIHKIKFILTSVTLLPIFYLFISRYVSERLVSRLSSLSFQENSRRVIYDIVINLIYSNPFGYGLNYVSSKFGFYPHNIFLEISVSGGIVSLVLMFLIVVLMLRRGLSAVRAKDLSIVAFSISIYYFLTWNVSFDLSSSYIPFSSIAILMISSEIRKIKNIKE